MVKKFKNRLLSSGCLSVLALVLSLLALFFELPLFFMRADFADEYVFKHRSIITAFGCWIAALSTWMFLLVRASKRNVSLLTNGDKKPSRFLNTVCAALPSVSLAACFLREEWISVVLGALAFSSLAAVTAVTDRTTTRIKQAAFGFLCGLTAAFLGVVTFLTWFGLTSRH